MTFNYPALGGDLQGPASLPGTDGAGEPQAKSVAPHAPCADGLTEAQELTACPALDLLPAKVSAKVTSRAHLSVKSRPGALQATPCLRPSRAEGKFPILGCTGGSGLWLGTGSGGHGGEVFGGVAPGRSA